MLKGAASDKTLQTLQIVGKLISSTTIKRASVTAGKEEKGGFNKETYILCTGRN